MNQWWQRAAIYQIFVRSFHDSDGDGEGDLNGIISRIDYLSWLGVDAIWLTPVNTSPLLDSGYDPSDFCAIEPIFGTISDFEVMVAEIHKRGMKIILDFVPNHTSERHPWFIESRSSRTNAKREWFVWRDPSPDGGPPNNWLDNVGNSAWTFDDKTGQYYYHRFLPEQPDLNWRNPDVEEAMLASMRFWLDQGVDGFRMDSIANLVEDDLLRDDPMEPEQSKGPPGWTEHVFTADRQETHDIIGRMRRLMDAYPDKVLFGEIHLPLGRLMDYVERGNPGLHFPINFQLPSSKPWTARTIDAAIDQYLLQLSPGAWPNWIIGSHYLPRVASRVGVAQARIAAMLLLTLRGTVIIYYGDELGLQDADVPEKAIRDPYAHRGVAGRDPQRSPMPWDGSEKAGFTTGSPWLPISDEAATQNAEHLQSDETSVLHLYRRLIEFRHSHRAILSGAQYPLGRQREILAYRRCSESDEFVVLLNFSDAPMRVDLDHPGLIRLSTCLDREGPVADSVDLRANEGIIIEVRKA
jgi:alpha-glucosidase